MMGIYGWSNFLVAMLLAGCGASHSDDENPISSGGSAELPDPEAQGDAGGQAIPQFAYGPENDARPLPGLLTSVQIVTATWNGDTEDLRPAIAAAFGPDLGSSAWWTALSKTCAPGTTECVNTTVTVTSSRIGDAPGTPVVDSALMQN